MSTTDMNTATRELFIRTVKNQVFMRTPILEEMQRRNTVTYRGGKYIEQLVETEEMDDLGQAYTATEALTDERKSMLDKPRFRWKYYQMPLKYDVDEYTQNIMAGEEEQLLDLAAFLTRKGQRGIKLALRNMMYNVNPTTRAGSETGVGDTSKFFQSLLSALDHDVTTYGNVSRTLGGTGGWWCGSDPEGRPDVVSSSSQNTGYSMSIYRLRQWIIPIMEYMENTTDLYIVMCPSLFNKLRQEAEAHGMGKIDQERVRYGITSFVLDDGHRVATDPYLESGYGTSGTTENWVFLLNMADWELRIHTERNFKMTDFKWQGDISNGHDYWLARILLSGNLMCWKPNGSMWLMNVS